MKNINSYKIRIKYKFDKHNFIVQKYAEDSTWDSTSDSILHLILNFRWDFTLSSTF